MLKAGDGVGIEGIRRFHKEASVTAALRHPNTVRVFDVGQAEVGALYLAMEHLHGSTLEEELRTLAEQGEVYGEKAALRIAEGVLRSLQEAHGAGLVHRDLKPGNIMLADVGEDEPQVKVLDFGIARTRDSSLTDEGTALGTPAYMSPEQCMGAALDGRSDLYSLGVILYRAVAGRCPFEDGNPLTVMYQATHVPAPSLAELARCDVSTGYVQLTHRALEKKADERFADARAMRERAVSRRRGPDACAAADRRRCRCCRRGGRWAALGDLGRATTSARELRARGGAPTRGPPVIGLAVGLVLLIAIGVVLALRDGAGGAGGDDGAASKPATTAGAQGAAAIAVPAAEDGESSAAANPAADSSKQALSPDAATGR